MDLKEFTKNTIDDIWRAVNESQTELDAEITLIKGSGDSLRHIEFDVAVTAEETQGTNVGGKIKVLSIIEGGGDKTSDSKNTVASRIRFGVTVRKPGSPHARSPN